MCNQNHCVKDQDNNCSCEGCLEEEYLKNKCSHEGCTSTDCLKNGVCVCKCEICNELNTQKESDFNQKDFENKDIFYLKTIDIWDKKQIQSNKYKSLFSFIQEGNIDSILGLHWFDDPVNGYWHNSSSSGINDLLEKIIATNDSEIITIAQTILKDQSNNDTIDLNKIKSQLSSILESTHPSSNSNKIRSNGEGQLSKPTSH